jgi:CrcB protein
VRFVLICLGGAVGTGARYLTTLGAAAAFGPSFPAGTLIVNVVGSFAIAFVMQIGGTGTFITPDARAILTTGVMGGFTTYSAFNYDATNYFRQGAWVTGFAYVAVTLLGCFAAGVAGLAVARLVAVR